MYVCVCESERERERERAKREKISVTGGYLMSIIHFDVLILLIHQKKLNIYYYLIHL
jgi:hypothetical protein